MTKIPEYNFKRYPDSGWRPDKQEQHNLRYWKAKPAKKKPTRKQKIPRETKAIFYEGHERLRQIRNEE